MKELNSYVRHTLKVIEEEGIDPAPFLAVTGVTYEELAAPTDCVDQDRYNQLLDLLVANFPNSGFGLLDGMGVSILEHGLLGYAMFASRDLRKAIERHTRYQDVIGAALHTKLIETHSDARLRVGNIARPELINTPAKLRYETERLLAQWAEIGPAFGASTRWFLSINFSYAKPKEYEHLYREVLGDNLNFDTEHTEIVFDSALLDAPFAHANEQAAILCEQQCAALLRQLTNTEGFIARVRRLLAANPGAPVAIRDVASRLGLSERSLRRRLAEEGTNFKSVVLQFRMELAASFLKGNEMAIQEIAYTVGYSDPSNFHRAFQTHYGATPAQYRLQKQKGLPTAIGA